MALTVVVCEDTGNDEERGERVWGEQRRHAVAEMRKLQGRIWTAASSWLPGRLCVLLRAGMKVRAGVQVTRSELLSQVTNVCCSDG